MDVRRIWKKKGAGTKAVVTAIACAAGVGLSWMIWEGALMAQSSPDMELWTDRVGEEAAELDGLCRGGFNELDGPHRRHCETLRHPLAPVGSDDTSVTARIDDQTRRVRGLSFSVEPYSPTFETSADGMARLVSWEESVATYVDEKHCLAVDVPYEEFGAWDCGDYVIAHSGVMAERRGRLSVQLWLGKSHGDVEEALHRRGHREHRRKAFRLQETAEEYLKLGLPGRAEEKLIRAEGLKQALDDR